MIKINKMGLVDYQESFALMKEFTNNRNTDTQDQIWTLQHPPVYTQGLAGKAHHLLQETNIPIIQTDRGGQITYHGPGQLIVCPLLKLQRYKLSIRGLVNLIELSLINSLKKISINAYQKDHAPGVYVAQDKIASLGLKIRYGCSYHGLALNIDMDLLPFEAINPCGINKLKMTQVSNFNDIKFEDIEELLIKELLDNLTPAS